MNLLSNHFIISFLRCLILHRVYYVQFLWLLLLGDFDPQIFYWRLNAMKLTAQNDMAEKEERPP